MATIQFTGERTGKTELMAPRVGVIHAGDTVEVTDEVALSWTTPLPTASGDLKADFAFVEAVPLPEDPAPEPRPYRGRHRVEAIAPTPEDTTVDAESEGENR